MRKNIFIAAAAILAFSACNSNQTSYSDKEKDSINQVDKDSADAHFRKLEEQVKLEADVAPAAPGDIKEVYPTPIIDPVQNEQKPHHDPHQGPIKPPAETGKK
jgi:hypothetical protein